MLRKKEWQLPVAFVCLCLGFLLAIQLQTQNNLRRSTTPTRRLETALELLKQAEKQKDALEDEIRPLRELATRVPNQKNLRAELQRLQVISGLTEVVGQGIVITLNDSERPTHTDENEANLLIHDEDILRTVNELWAAGAEAISVNGERIVSTSAIRCVGPTILVNANRVGPPYVIEAIGDKQSLMQVEMIGGIVDYLKTWGIDVKVDWKDSLHLNAYDGSISARYAKPLEGGAN